MGYVLALDQGTSSSRSILFDAEGRICAVAQQEFTQHYPHPGWVEHDPQEIWHTQAKTIEEVLEKAKINTTQIDAVGIANQRETVVLWDRKTGLPVCNAIVWQDRRTAPLCDALRADGVEDFIREKTGLRLDPYFSGTKLRWMLDHVEGVRERAEGGELAFGTIDAWLLWKLTDGQVHATEPSNASRTLLFNIHTMRWDSALLELLKIPPTILPKIEDSNAHFGTILNPSVLSGCPVFGMLGDQQAALFGQGCLEAGSAKNTYGTGCFLLMNTADRVVTSSHKMLSTVAWKRSGKTVYALEGSVFSAGAAVQWLRDGLGIIHSAAEIESLAAEVPDTAGVCFIPAFSGLGAPHWEPDARGLLSGLTRGTRKAHIARAVLESICFQSVEVLRAMEKDAGMCLPLLRVDGGATVNNLLMQLQADLLQVPVWRPRHIETTAFGAALISGVSAGLWASCDEMGQWGADRVFEPSISSDEAESRYQQWHKALLRSFP
jgi:glycerol kinase